MDVKDMAKEIGKAYRCDPDKGQGEGYQVLFETDVSQERVEIGDETLNLYIKDDRVVGVDTGTVFKGPMPTTGLMYAFTEITEDDNGQIDPEKSKTIVAERDRYDGGSLYEETLKETYDSGWRIPDYALENLLGKKTDEIDLLKK